MRSTLGRLLLAVLREHCTEQYFLLAVGVVNTLEHLLHLRLWRFFALVVAALDGPITATFFLVLNYW